MIDRKLFKVQKVHASSEWYPSYVEFTKYFMASDRQTLESILATRDSDFSTFGYEIEELKFETIEAVPFYDPDLPFAESFQ